MPKVKAKEEDSRDALEAQLMGGEIQEGELEEEPEIAVSSESEAEPEKEPEPEVTLEELKERLAKAEKERHDFERAMREEREAKKTSDRTLQTLVERLENIQAEKKVEESVIKPPIYEDDPAAYLKWQNEQIIEDRRKEKETRNQDEQINVQLRQYQQLHQTIKQGINQYAEITPDYNDAAKYLIESRIKELEIMGIRDKNEQLQTLTQEEVQVGHWALQRGISPGELIYNLAKTRGYQKSVQTSKESGDGDKPRPKSLSNISGSPSGNKESLQARAERLLAATNLKDVLALNQDEMEKVLKEAR